MFTDAEKIQWFDKLFGFAQECESITHKNYFKSFKTAVNEVYKKSEDFEMKQAVCEADSFLDSVNEKLKVDENRKYVILNILFDALLFHLEELNDVPEDEKHDFTKLKEEIIKVGEHLSYLELGE